MNAHQMNYIIDSVLNWTGPRKAAVTEHFINPDLSVNSIQMKYFSGWEFNVARDIATVDKIYNQAFNVINANSL